MTPGSILLDRKYAFQSGDSGQKFVIVLNDGSDYPYIIVRTTSQQKNRGTIFGCQSNDRFPNFFLPQGSCYFSKHTWIQLEDFREFHIGDLLDKLKAGEIFRAAELPKDLTIKLLRCAISCDDISHAQAGILQKILAIL